jgi:hypothetical protein
MDDILIGRGIAGARSSFLDHTRAEDLMNRQRVVFSGGTEVAEAWLRRANYGRPSELARTE